MQPNTSVANRLRQLADRLSASPPVLFIRSRRSLAAASAVCLLILGLIVLSQPADNDNFAVDDFDLGEFEEVTIGEQPVAAVSGPSSDAPLTASEGPFDPSERDLTPSVVTLIPTAVPQPDRGIRRLASGPAPSAEKPAAWLTGTIEE